MAGFRQLGLKVPKSKSTAAGPNLFAGAKIAPAPKLKPTYKKPAADSDPMKFGNFGYDLNMKSPSILAKAKPFA